VAILSKRIERILLTLPNAAVDRNQGFEVRRNRPRAVGYQPSAQNFFAFCKEVTDKNFIASLHKQDIDEFNFEMFKWENVDLFACFVSVRFCSAG
jgi:hypothetical protein